MRRTRRYATISRPLAAPRWGKRPTRSRWMKCWPMSGVSRRSSDRSRAAPSRPSESGSADRLYRRAPRRIGLRKDLPEAGKKDIQRVADHLFLVFEHGRFVNVFAD